MIFEENCSNNFILHFRVLKKRICIVKKIHEILWMVWIKRNLQMTHQIWAFGRHCWPPKRPHGHGAKVDPTETFGSGIKLLIGFNFGNSLIDVVISPGKIGPSDQICYIYLLPCGWYQMKFGIYLSICLRVPMHSIPPSTERWVQKKKKICSALLYSWKKSYFTKVRNQRASFDLQRSSSISSSKTQLPHWDHHPLPWYSIEDPGPK